MIYYNPKASFLEGKNNFLGKGEGGSGKKSFFALEYADSDSQLNHRSNLNLKGQKLVNIVENSYL